MEETTIYVWTGLGAVVGTLMLVAVMLWASQTTLRQARAMWQLLRGYRANLESKIDEPTDSLIRELARLSTLPPTLWSAFLTALLRSIAEGLDEMRPLPPEGAPGPDIEPEADAGSP